MASSASASTGDQLVSEFQSNQGLNDVDAIMMMDDLDDDDFSDFLDGPYDVDGLPEVTENAADDGMSDVTTSSSIETGEDFFDTQMQASWETCSSSLASEQGSGCSHMEDAAAHSNICNRGAMEPQEARSVDPSVEYNEALNKLAASMKRTEASRARIIQQRQALEVAQRQVHIQGHQQPNLQSMSSLAGFFSGRSTTLTSGLEQSRRQLQTYMASVKMTSMV